MQDVDYKKYKGLMDNFPSEEKKLFSIDIYIFKDSASLPSKLEDEELEKLLSKISDKSVKVRVGDVDEDFEEYIDSISDDLYSASLEAFYYLRITRGLPMNQDGYFITKDGALIGEMLSESESENYATDISSDTRELLEYLKSNYLIYPRKS